MGNRPVVMARCDARLEYRGIGPAIVCIMRLWTVHPRHLDGVGIVAQWREAAGRVQGAGHSAGRAPWRDATRRSRASAESACAAVCGC